MMREEKKISKVKEESCPLINPGFTQPQLQELQHQTLIHRHIAAGLPVPFHLVLPIWKSVSSSLGSSPFAIFKQFPSFIGFSPQGLDYRHVMESDPGRCRRTDGKKWRCSKNVVADQKYCERHIHRGRQRSRKLVEASDVASTSNPTTTMPKKSKVKSPPPPPPQNPSSSLLALQLMTPSDSVNRGSSTTTTSNLSNKRVSYVTSPYIAANTNGGTITSAIATNNSSPVLTSTKSSQNVGRYMGEMCYGNASTNKNISVGGNLSPALGFSPRSVLQVVCRNGLGIDIQNGVEREPGRCRRTDGKKWRCRRDVIPDQKYCARHMHRGVKKPAKAIEPTTSSADTNTVPLPLAIATATSCRTDRPTPNTNLSISISTSPPPPTCKDEKSESGNSSDTTITDTTISAYTVGKVPS